MGIKEVKKVLGVDCPAATAFTTAQDRSLVQLFEAYDKQDGEWGKGYDAGHKVGYAKGNEDKEAAYREDFKRGRAQGRKEADTFGKAAAYEQGLEVGRESCLDQGQAYDAGVERGRGGAGRDWSQGYRAGRKGAREEILTALPKGGYTDWSAVRAAIEEFLALSGPQGVHNA